MRIFRRFIGFVAFAVLAAPALAQAPPAADIVGRWQGTLNNGQAIRVVLVIAKAEDGHYTGQRYLIDQGVHPVALETVDFKAGVFTFKQGPVSYRGEVSADGQHIKGAPFDLDRAPKTGPWPLPAVTHTAKMITVDDGVKLEVLDFDGSGPPLVFLAGLGADAHVFDMFAPRFTAKHHVYAFTRRGYGASDKPEPGKASYAADRLADDVLQAMTQLKIEKPVLAGWSIAGEELSAVSTRAPEKVAGLAYLDAAYVYSLYTPGAQVPAGDSLAIDLNDFREKVRKVTVGGVSREEALKILDELIDVNLKELETDLRTTRESYQRRPPSASPPAPKPAVASSLGDRISAAILDGLGKYTEIKPPALAIYALPGSLPPNPNAQQFAAAAALDAGKEQAAKTFAAVNPGAHVVKLANAQHAVFISHPDEVFREMDAFIDGLPH